MEFNDLIRVRESIRDYDPQRKVPSDVLERIIDAGRLAPSAANRQPWKFILVSSASVLEKVKDCYKRDWLKDAPHILIAVGMKDEAWKRSFDGYNAVETDVAIALTHILLAAENEGVGSCWIANFDPVRLNDVINPAPGQTIFGMLPLGYPKSGFRKAGSKKRKNREETVEYM